MLKQLDMLSEQDYVNILFDLARHAVDEIPTLKYMWRDPGSNPGALVRKG